MPPFIDCDYGSMKFYVYGPEGKTEISLADTKVIEVEPIYNEEMYSLQDIDFESVMEITVRIRYSRGLFDSLCGIQSIHAWRYKRLCKRHKEKERRRRLKERC